MKPAPATAKAEETRLRILRAAIELFRNQGFDQTTMREIAGEAGVAIGAAYYYFASKEAMVMGFYELASGEMAPLAAGQPPTHLRAGRAGTSRSEAPRADRSQVSLLRAEPRVSRRTAAPRG